MSSRRDRTPQTNPEIRDRLSKPFSHYVKQFYFDACRFCEPALMMAQSCLGSNRLMFGTDYPYVEADGTHVELLPQPDDEKRAIIGANAKLLFSLD